MDASEVTCVVAWTPQVMVAMQSITELMQENLKPPLTPRAWPFSSFCIVACTMRVGSREHVVISLVYGESCGRSSLPFIQALGRTAFNPLRWPTDFSLLMPGVAVLVTVCG